MISPRGVLSFVALGAAAAFTFWVLQISAPREVREKETRHEPDYHFDSPRITRYGVGGALELDLTAAHAVHYPDDDSVALDQVALDLRTREGARWTMVAAHAIAPMKGSIVSLDGGVRIARPRADAKSDARPDANDGAVELRSERVTLDTSAQRIETAEAVEMLQGGNRTTAVGLVADLGADRITFKSHVRSSYVMR